jgi:hypothetical protein
LATAAAAQPAPPSAVAASACAPDGSPTAAHDYNRHSRHKPLGMRRRALWTARNKHSVVAPVLHGYSAWSAACGGVAAGGR